MKSSKSSTMVHSFQDLEVLLKRKSVSLPHHRHRPDEDRGDDKIPGLDEKLFSKAMEGVKPISKDNHIERVSQMEFPEGFRIKEDSETLVRLENLIRYGEGFNVSDTPEYVEGIGYHVHPSIAKRLHQGDFAIQAHVDLHGLCADEAEEVFEKFIRWAVITGKRGILIIHGRGLSSPSEPVLKKKVIEWLTRGPWRKWVIAYSSARRCDGGAGATYVLLRQRPVSKRLRIRTRKTEKRREEDEKIR